MTTPNDSPFVNVTEPKHDDFLNCGKWSLEPGEYQMFENGTAYVEAYNMTYNSSFYILEGDRLIVCSPIRSDDTSTGSEDDSKYSLSLSYITQVGLSISLVCLFLHVLVFCLVRELRNLPGYNMTSLCSALFFGYLFFLVGFLDPVRDCFASCVVMAAGTHFFLLASFFWMNTMAFDVLGTLLRATGKLRLASVKFTWKTFSLYSLYSWGIPSALTAAAIAADNVPQVPAEYKPQFGQELCWFGQKKPLLMFFAAPVFLLIAVNMVIFAASAFIIYRHSMSGDDVDRNTLKRNLTIYLRLAVIMGATWTVGILSSTLDSIVLWYLFVVLNTLQGLFIFLAFTCTTKVRKHFRQKFDILRRRRHSTTPTFQSYCNYGMSVQSVDRI